MAKNINYVSHKKSKVKVNGKPQLPSADSLVEGEIAINFAENVETLSIKNESGAVVTFSSDNYYSEQKLGSGFTGANSAVTVTDALSGKVDVSAYTEYWISGSGENSVVLNGSSSTASGDLSVAEGRQTSATSIGAHAEGQGSIASGQYSHAEGNGGAEASGGGSHAEGAGTKASGNMSHAEGAGTKATGDYSHSEGLTSSALTQASHAEGQGSIASGEASHAEGSNSIAGGSFSHAEGNSSIASGNTSHAEGNATKAIGNQSHAEGYNSIASGETSHAEGYSTITNNNSEHASGRYNVSNRASTDFGNSGNTLFSVGNGTANDARHNAFEIRQNGDIYIVNKDGNDVRLQDEIGNITVDQVLDDTTSASTNPVATKAVYNVITDNELVWSMAFLAMSGNVSSHTVNTNIHMTPTEKTNIDALASNIGTLSGITPENIIDWDSASSDKHTHANKSVLDGITSTKVSNWDGAATNSHTHSNKATLDAITATSTAINSLTGSVGTMAFQNTSSYSSATQVNTALSNKANTSDIANFFDDAKYEDSGTTKVINFYHGNTIKATIDATDFIVDGMVDDVRIENGNLVIDFNTASGKQDISIPLTDIFDPSNYYDKDDIDDLVGSGFTSSSITDVIIENEEIVSNALTDLDERKLDASAYTPTDLSNYYTKSQTSGATELTTAFGAKVDSSTFTAHTASTVHMNNTEKTNLDSLATNIAAISGITSAKVGNWDTAYTNNHTHSNKTYLDSITGNVGTMAYQATSSYSSATEVQTALNSKANTATTLAGYGITDAYTKPETSGKTEIENALNAKVNTADIVTAITPSNSGSTNPIATKVVAENELIVSNALTDLDERKLDASAYTPTDLSNYYTKSETSGATEIETALSGKANTATTLGGYGITDAYTKAQTSGATEISTALSGKVDATEYATFSASTNDSIDDLSGQSQTIAAAINDLHDNKLDITAYTPTTLLEEITYSALKSKRDNGQLVQGQWYRITDYTCTTTQENTQSAGHVFDIIVRADDVNVLNENAYAAKHSGDTYFTNASAKLNAWELKYSLDNDRTKYYWADRTNGKGVIYYMKDEWNNECPYDFKNIQFKRYKITASTKCPDLIGLYAIDGATDVTVDTATTYWSYTFCMYDLNENAPCDVSTYQDKYHDDDDGYYPKNYNNVFKPYLKREFGDGLLPMKLLDNVFITDTDICLIEEDYGAFYGFYSNTFGNGCYSNTFGNGCGYNSFGNGCYNNTFGGYYYTNTFGNGCYSNTFGYGCYNNTFGNECYENTFANDCGYNSFGNGCSNNSFGNRCSRNTFGNGCQYNTLSKDYSQYNIIENGNQYITLTSTQTTSGSNLLRNIKICQGVNNTTTTKTISHDTVNDTFQTEYKPVNSQIINV